LADALLVRHRLDARADPQVFERLRLAAEGIKIELSSADRVETRIRELGFGPGGVSLDLDFALTRSEFETLAAPLVERTLRVCKEAMTFAHLDVGSFERVVLVGGSVHIPFVRRRVEAFFRIAPTVHLNPEEVVAMGAAIQAAALSDATRVRSIPAAPTPRVQMHEPEGGPRPTPRISLHPKSGAFALDQIAQATERATLMSTPPPAGSSSVKVAVPTAPRMPSFPGFGEAARRGPSQPPPAVVSPVAPVLVDVTPRALVVETAGGFCDVVVARNSKIPCERSRGFATVQDGQTCVRVRVAQGEAEHFVDNFYLGEIELSGLRPAPRGEVLVIVVGFEVDANGTLKVRASEQATGLEARATLQLDVVSGDLSIARMQARAASIPMA
jgi:molecular chaperone DnaK